MPMAVPGSGLGLGLVLVLVLLLAWPPAWAGAPSADGPGGGRGEAPSVYQRPAAFLAEVFGGRPPRPRVLWLTGGLRRDVARILGHPPRSLRVRYWARDGRTAWILEEIGKERPITVGVVVRDGRIERLRVLIYRESRGMEVRHPFFTRRLEGARLRPDLRLDRRVDAVSGATLSSRALVRVARLALRLDQAVRERERGRGGGP
ncbi:MAG: FMN-binding protein [Gammaproteobacteria bacterium]|nr:MAG: FMN-binding protein [Gammaproteobacteria bacterium]